MAEDFFRWADNLIWDRSLLRNLYRREAAKLPKTVTIAKDEKVIELDGIGADLWLTLEHAPKPMYFEKLLQFLPEYKGLPNTVLRHFAIDAFSQLEAAGLITQSGEDSNRGSTRTKTSLEEIASSMNLRAAERKLESVSWNWTNVCNFDCKHCYSRTEEFNFELNVTQSKRIAEQIYEVGAPVIRFGGGECLLKRGFFEVLEHASSLGIHCQLTTNGFKFNIETAKELKSAGLRVLNVSIDGSNGEAHDILRRRAGSFDRALHCVEVASEAGIETHVISMMSADTLSEPSQLIEMVSSRGAKQINFKVVKRAGNAKQNQEVLPDKAALASCLAELNKINQQENANIRIDFGQNSEPIIESKYTNLSKGGGSRSRGCSCGYTSVCIKPDGAVTPCAYMDLKIGSLLEQELSEIWHSSDFFNILSNIEEAAAQGICGTCKSYSTCRGGCAAQRIENRKGVFEFKPKDSNCLIQARG